MMQTEPLSMTQLADRRIRSFRQRFGDGHFYLACHAALPLALTPDLLYRLWATFQRDCHDDDLAMPWIAVSDLLLSGLCDEVGDELYEMDSTVRDSLMQQLKDSPRLGLARVRELAEFVIAYIDPQRASADLDTRDFAQAQHWRALAYQQPREAVQAIATTLAELSFDETHEWMRMAALVETLEDPLEEFPELLVYVGAIDNFVRGNDRSAIDKLKQIANTNQQIQIADVDLPIPVEIKPDPLPPEPVRLERKIHLIDLLKQNSYWLIGGGIAVTTVAIVVIPYIFSGTETSSTPPSTISSTTSSPKPTLSQSTQLPLPSTNVTPTRNPPNGLSATSTPVKANPASPPLNNTKVINQTSSLSGTSNPPLQSNPTRNQVLLPSTPNFVDIPMPHLSLVNPKDIPLDRQNPVHNNLFRASEFATLGNELLGQNKPDEALIAYRKVLDISPDDISAQYNLSVAYNQLGYNMHSRRNLKEGTDAYKKAIKLKPDNPLYYYNLGNVLYDQQELQESINTYRKAIELDSQYYTYTVYAYTGLGNALYKQNNLQEAIAAYSKAMELYKQQGKIKDADRMLSLIRAIQ